MRIRGGSKALRYQRRPNGAAEKSSVGRYYIVQSRRYLVHGYRCVVQGRGYVFFFGTTLSGNSWSSVAVISLIDTGSVESSR